MTLVINGSAHAEDSGPFVASATQGNLRVYHYRTAPAVAAAGAIHAAITLAASGTTTTTAGITQPDFPRVLAITGNALNEAGNVVINGTDASGATISDTIALNGSAQVVGVKAFATVTSIVTPQRTNVADTVTIDTLNIFGLPHVVSSARYILLHDFDGSNDAGTLAVSATLSANLYTIAGTPNAAKILALVYMVA